MYDFGRIMERWPNDHPIVEGLSDEEQIIEDSADIAIMETGRVAKNIGARLVPEMVPKPLVIELLGE